MPVALSPEELWSNQIDAALSDANVFVRRIVELLQIASLVTKKDLKKYIKNVELTFENLNQQGRIFPDSRHALKLLDHRVDLLLQVTAQGSLRLASAFVGLSPREFQRDLDLGRGHITTPQAMPGQFEELHQALTRSLRTALSRASSWAALAEKSLSTTLDAAAPAQEPTAYQFGVSGSQIVVATQLPTPAEGHDGIVAQTYDHLLASCDRVQQVLDQSQLPRNLKSIFENVAALLKTRTDIVKLGLETNQAALALALHLAASPDELSGVQRGALEGHLTSIQSYVAQFDDWIKFQGLVDQAASSDPDNLAALREILEELNSRREAHADWLSADAQDAIAWLKSLVGGPKPSIKDRGAALLSLRNLYSAIAKLIASLAKEQAEEAKKKLMETVADHAVSALSDALTTLRRGTPDGGFYAILLDAAIAITSKKKDDT